MGGSGAGNRSGSRPHRSRRARRPTRGSPSAGGGSSPGGVTPSAVSSRRACPHHGAAARSSVVEVPYGPGPARDFVRVGGHRRALALRRCLFTPTPVSPSGTCASAGVLRAASSWAWFCLPSWSRRPGPVDPCGVRRPRTHGCTSSAHNTAAAPCTAPLLLPCAGGRVTAVLPGVPWWGSCGTGTPGREATVPPLASRSPMPGGVPPTTPCTSGAPESRRRDPRACEGTSSVRARMHAIGRASQGGPCAIVRPPPQPPARAVCTSTTPIGACTSSTAHPGSTRRVVRVPVTPSCGACAAFLRGALSVGRSRRMVRGGRAVWRSSVGTGRGDGWPGVRP